MAAPPHASHTAVLLSANLIYLASRGHYLYSFWLHWFSVMSQASGCHLEGVKEFVSHKMSPNNNNLGGHCKEACSL
jgi:hypothetical protein